MWKEQIMQTKESWLGFVKSLIRKENIMGGAWQMKGNRNCQNEQEYHYHRKQQANSILKLSLHNKKKPKCK